MTKKDETTEENCAVDVDELIENHFGDMIIAFLYTSRIKDIEEAHRFAGTTFDLLIEKLDGKPSMVWDEAFRISHNIISVHTWKDIDDVVNMIIQVSEQVFNKWESNQ